MKGGALALNPVVANGETLGELRGVTHEFRLPSGSTLRVLEDINLTIRPNEIVALLGPSGCGKSTLLRILAGLMTPSHGEVLEHGRALHGLHPGVAIVFQSFALYPWMTVKQNVAAALEVRGLPHEEIESRTEAIIRSVGLASFADTFPRALSGGMKQRVGIARALVVDPELLMMDEPFSAVDALTAEGLRAEVVDLWALADRNPSSILVVSHDIHEVVFMADRIVVMGAHPGRVRAVIENPLSRPRDYRAPDFLRLVDQLHDVITGAEMPDVPELPPSVAPPVEPLPDVSPTEILGLLEYLDARGGTDELFHIAADTHREFGHLIAVVKASEMLDFVDTPKRNVMLTAAGRAFLAATVPARRSLWAEQLMKMRLFRDVVGVIRKQEDGTVERDFVLEMLALALPGEDHERLYDTFLRWARAGELLDEDPHSGQLSLEAVSARAEAGTGDGGTGD